MKTHLLLLLVAAGLSGCAHHARHYAAPDSARLRSAATRLDLNVVAATGTAEKARGAVATAKASAGQESGMIAAITPRVEALLRVSPAALRPEIQALRADVLVLENAHKATVAAIGGAETEHVLLAGQLAEADTARSEVARFSPTYFAEVDRLAEKANQAETGWARDAKALAWYRLHWWGTWIVAGLGVAACGLFAFLKFTGRIAAHL